VNSKLSLAIGPTLNYSSAILRRGVGLQPGDQFEFDGNGFGFGFTAGLFFHPWEQWAFGVNYHSATSIDYEGHSSTSPTAPFPPYYPQHSTHATIDFPQFVAVGVSYRPTTNWNFEVDVDWTDWDVVNSIVFKGTPLGDLPFVLNYQSGLMYEFGMTRKLPNGYFVSAGYIYSENSSPERYFNPIVPDANLHLGSIGFGHKGERWDWAIGYHFALNPGRDINNNVDPVVNGHYKTFNNAVNFSITYKFK
jgi:long-chain fatty acid transport protein